MKASAIGAALVLALILTMPAEGRHSRRAVCVPTYEPGVGPGYFLFALCPQTRPHMNYILVVTRNFGQYRVGDQITDPREIAAVKDLYAPPYFVEVPYTLPPPPQPLNPAVGASDSLTIIRNGVPRMVQVSDLQFAGVTRHNISDNNYAAASTDGYIAYVALTLGRTVTLPMASSFPTSQVLYIADETGNCSTSIPIIVAAQGADTIGGQIAIQMGSPYQKLACHSNGSNLWTVG